VVSVITALASPFPVLCGRSKASLIYNVAWEIAKPRATMHRIPRFADNGSCLYARMWPVFYF
jgi:hypothetical protein